MGAIIATTDEIAPGGHGVIAAARRVRACSAIAALALTGLCSGADAHDPGLSTLSLTLSDRPARAQLVLVIDDNVLPEPRSAHAARCHGLSPFAIRLRSTLQPASVSCRAESAGRTRFEASIFFEGSGTLRVQLPLLDVLPRGHQVYARLERANGQAALERILRQSSDSLELDVQAPPAGSFWLRGNQLFAAQLVQLLLLPWLLWGLGAIAWLAMRRLTRARPPAPTRSCDAGPT